jgi:hypothetical protein
MTFVGLMAWLSGHEVRLAVLPADGEASAGMAALLESQLAGKPGLAVVDRAGIEAILREQKLQALFSPQAIGQRALLGKLLKADILVMLRRSSPPEKGFELIACETKQGLRLCVERVPESDSPSADMTFLQKIVSQALKKHAEAASQIVAVPPLVSNDLSLAGQAFQRPLAKVIEQALLLQPGVLIVETAEAKALATEMALTNAANTNRSGIERKMPLYLLGEYRHEGFSGDSPLSFQLRLLRSEKQIGARVSPSMTTAEAARALPRRAIELLNDALASAKQAEAIPTEGDEAAQLAARAQTMFRVESWPEAVDLAEASLLLKPSQVPVHRLAAQAILLEARRLSESHGAGNEDKGNRHIQALYEQGLPHLEFFMAGSNFTLRNDLVVLAPYLFYCADKAALRSMMLRVLAAKQAAGSGDETVRACLEVADSCCADIASDELDRWKLDAARAWPDAADADGRVLSYLMLWRVALSDKNKLALLAQSLRALDSAVAHRAADLLDRLPTETAQKIKADRNARRADRNGALVRGAGAAAMRHFSLRREIWGAFAAGPNVDVAWDGNWLYLWATNKSATPQPLLHILAEPGGTPVCYDGRFVWAWHPKSSDSGAAKETDQTAPGLVAIDGASKHISFIGKSGGLPKDEVRSVSLAPIAPGKVCVVGHFGPEVGGRAWIALATTGESRKGKISIVHEARDFNQSAAADWKNPHLAFDVSRAHTLRFAKPDGGMQTAVLIERGGINHPLLIDPETLKVTVVEDPVGSETISQAVEHDGAFYWLGRSDHGYMIHRYALPKLKIERGEQVFAHAGNLFF